MEYQEILVDSPAEYGASETNAGELIIESIENNQFLLLYQLIDPLAITSGEAMHYGVLVRLTEEEENLMPPGAFFAVAEEHGLMPYLDRWVIRNVLICASRPRQEEIVDKRTMFFINLAGDTIRNPEFPGFVQKSLKEFDIAGSVLCFEIPYADLSLLRANIGKFIQAIRALGCRVAISGCGQQMVSLELISHFQFDFLKMDGIVINNVHRDPVSLAKTKALTHVAKRIGVKTIAEFVESEETVAKLREIGIDYVQGYGISSPRTFEPDQPVSIQRVNV